MEGVLLLALVGTPGADVENDAPLSFGDLANSAVDAADFECVRPGASALGRG